MYEIYRLTSPSGKHYIGQTNQGYLKRFSQHVTAWRRWIKDGRPRKSYQTKLFYAFDRYLPTDWQVKIIFETNDREKMNSAEILYITIFDTVDDGYNIQKGGQKGWVDTNISDEHRSNMSIARKAFYETEEGKAWLRELGEKSRKYAGENHPMFGKPAWNRGVPRNPEWSRKAAETQKEWWETPEGLAEKERKTITAREMGKRNAGRKMTDEQKAAHSKALTGHVQPQSQKDTVSEKVSKFYIVTFPDGHEELIKGLRRFCLPRGLSDGNMHSKSGSKGYRARLATPEEIDNYLVSKTE